MGGDQPSGEVPCRILTLGGLVVCRMEDMVQKLQLGGTWVYTPIGAELATVGLDEIRVYINRLQNTVT